MAKQIPTIGMLPYDELCGNTEKQYSFKSSGEEIVMLPVEKLLSYKRHTMKVEKNVSMAELVRSVGRFGIFEPLLILPADANGNNEVVAGHRRLFAAKINGLKEVPCTIKKMSEAEADNAMADTNIHRTDDEVSIIELANTYRLKKEALEKLNAENITYESLEKELGESKNKIHRYIRITYLISELQELTDKKKIAFLAAVEISYLTKTEQQLLMDAIRETEIMPGLEQAKQMHVESKGQPLDRRTINLLLQKKEPKTKILLKQETLKKYFPAGTAKKDMETTIIELLEKWTKNK